MVPHGPSPFSIACSRLRDSGEKSFSKKKREKRAGAGQRQGIFLAATSPFPKLRPHYTIWEPGTGYVQHSSCIKYMIVSFFNTEAFSLRIHELKMKSGFLSSNGTEQSEALSVSVWFRSKELPRKGTFGFDRARNETRATFLAVFDSRSSFFSPEPHRNACYAG